MLCDVGLRATSSNFRTEARLEPLINLNNFISDSAVKNCNNLFWTKNVNLEVVRLWSLGKEVGFSLDGEKEQVIETIGLTEVRDKKEFIDEDN